MTPLAAAREMSSGYTERLPCLLGEVKPPRWAQMVPASGEARYFSSASDCGVSLSITATSPPATTEVGEPLTDGKGKKLEPVLAARVLFTVGMTEPTKSAS